MAGELWRVALHVYDLSNGLAKQLSKQLCGVQVDGIWHTGLVVYDREFYFGDGVHAQPPMQTPYGVPVRVHQLGFTTVPVEVFREYLLQVSKTEFTPQSYHVFDHNCNTFSAAAAGYLLDGGESLIPDYITDLPAEIMNTPLGAMIRPMVDRMMPATAAKTVPKALVDAGLKLVDSVSGLVLLTAPPAELAVLSTVQPGSVARMSGIVLPALADIHDAAGAAELVSVVRLLVEKETLGEPLTLDREACGGGPAELMQWMNGALVHAPEDVWFALIDLVRIVVIGNPQWGLEIVQLDVREGLMAMVHLLQSSHSFAHSKRVLRSLRRAFTVLLCAIGHVVGVLAVNLDPESAVLDPITVNNLDLFSAFAGDQLGDIHAALRLAASTVLLNTAAVLVSLVKIDQARAEDLALDLIKRALSSLDMELDPEITLRRMTALGRCAMLTPTLRITAPSLCSLGNMDAERYILDPHETNIVKSAANELLFIGM